MYFRNVLIIRYFSILSYLIRLVSLIRFIKQLNTKNKDSIFDIIEIYYIFFNIKQTQLLWKSIYEIRRDSTKPIVCGDCYVVLLSAILFVRSVENISHVCLLKKAKILMFWMDFKEAKVLCCSRKYDKILFN